MFPAEKKLGIIGGMGSFASANLYNTILSKSPARNDAEHIEIIIHNNARIPDRTRGILYNGPDPFPEILRSARMMDNLQVDYLLMACVTAHYYCDLLQEKLHYTTILNLLDVITHHIREQLPTVRKVGLLATTGVIKTQMWHKKLRNIGVEVICLPPAAQESVFMEAIYGNKGVKSGVLSDEPQKKLIEACHMLTNMGVDAIMSSCSEIPLVLRQQHVEVLLIDAFDVLTDHVLAQFYS